jgi:drug/metabolite transporter (DMT)-like permease
LVLFGLAFLGIIFVYFNQELSFANKDFLGMTAMIGSTLIYSVVVTIFKKESLKYTKLQSVFYQNLVGAVIFLPFLFLNKPIPTPAQAGLTSFYVILIGIIGFSLFFSALKKIKLSTASSLCYVEVVSAILFGIIIFKEILTWNMMVGGILIILSTVLLKKDKNHAPQDISTKTI